MQYLAEILAVNKLTLKELKAIAGTQIRPKRRSKHSPRQKFIFSLVKAGLKIPYHTRPICTACEVHFIPVVWHQQKCSICSNRKSDHLDLTPDDCSELGLSFDKANEHLHLPESYREYYNLLNSKDLA